MKKFIMVIISLALVGCFSAKYVEKHEYLLSMVQLPVQHHQDISPELIVNRVGVLAPFDQVHFLYRLTDNQYLTDYYNSFIIPPNQQLDQVLVNYFKALGKFAVTDSATATHKLDVMLAEWYADYRDRNSPQATVALHFSLNKQVDGKNKNLLDRTFKSSTPIRKKDVAGLLQAWQQSVRIVIEQGVRACNHAIND